MRSPADWRTKAVVTVAAVLLTAAPAPGAFACGYEDPQSVSRGFLNWIYPDSLHVMGAISTEVAARRLPPPNFDRARVDLFGRRYNATKMALEQFGEMLRAASSSPSQPSVSLVLVEPVLWTRFERGADGLHARVHVSGAGPGDLVLVSGEAVISEVAGGRLTIGQATKTGLIRIYGLDEQKAKFLGTYQQVGSRPLTTGWSRSREPKPAPITSPQPPGALQQGTSAAAESGGEPVRGPVHH